MSSFNFALRPLAAVSPWGQPGHLRLSWFGLTEGWYWWEAGNADLFRYTPAIVQHWQQIQPEITEPAEFAYYVDYYVVRLWEDLLQMLPAVLEPLPAPLVTRLTAPANGDTWHHQFQQKWAREDDEDLATKDLYADAGEWWRERRLDTSYLRAGPNIWLWTDGSTLAIEWDNRGEEIAGHPVWAATQGRATMPLAGFLDALTAFDAQLMEAMAARIARIDADWPYPDVFIDRQRLHAEQQERATWLAEALTRARARPPTPWEPVLDRLRRIDQR